MWDKSYHQQLQAPLDMCIPLYSRLKVIISPSRLVAGTACPQSSLMKELAGGLACLLSPAAIFAVTTVLLKLKTSQMVMEKLMSL